MGKSRPRGRGPTAQQSGRSVARSRMQIDVCQHRAMRRRPVTARSTRPVHICALIVLLGACAARTDAVDPTLAPLVPAESLPQETVAATTTTIGRAEPAPPLVAALPDSDCAFAPAPAGGEITFVSGDRLYGTTPD